MTRYHLAQVNIGRLRAHIDDPMIADFKAGLGAINAVADASAGFVWRLVGEGDDATDLQPDTSDPLLAINMSVWEDVASLGAFVYRSGHIGFMRRRREWFEPMDDFMALWWIPVGHRPSVAEAMGRLELLARMGPTADAFTFKSPFPAPDSIAPPLPILDECA